MEQLDYNLLFRWFVGLNMDDVIWDVTVFTKNRERLLDGDIAEAFFQAVLQQARERSLLSDEHFTVEGTLLEAWASVKSYQRKDVKNAVPPDDPGNATVTSIQDFLRAPLCPLWLVWDLARGDAKRSISSHPVE
jgi:hypothetical protein